MVCNVSIVIGFKIHKFTHTLIEYHGSMSETNDDNNIYVAMVATRVIA